MSGFDTSNRDIISDEQREPGAVKLQAPSEPVPVATALSTVPARQTRIQPEVPTLARSLAPLVFVISVVWSVSAWSVVPLLWGIGIAMLAASVAEQSAKRILEGL